MTDPLVDQLFPGLAQHNYRVTSPATDRYNCIAWAASRDDRPWWPHVDAYWPPGIAVAQTIVAFEAAYGTLGYRRCSNASFDIRLEKVALFADPSGTPTHAARQLANGKWTSKLGRHVDIEHSTPEALNGNTYGQVVMFMERRRSIHGQFIAWLRHVLLKNY